MGTELNLKDTVSYINNVETESQTRKLSVFDIYTDNIFYLGNSTLFIKPTFRRATSWFGAQQDPSSIPKTESHAQYQVLKLYGYLNSNFNIPKTSVPLNYMLTFDSQKSFDALFSSEQFNIGGQYSVRGFDENSINGDNGYSVRNDLKINTIYLLPEKIKNSSLFTFGADKNFSISQALSKTSLGIFYDYGYIRNKYLTRADSEGYMAGAGTKLDYNGENFSWNLTYSKALRSPKFIQNIYGQQSDNETIYFTFNFMLGLL